MAESVHVSSIAAPTCADVELLVRWAQANALMPAMQFSIPPWDLSKEADKLCQAALAVSISPALIYVSLCVVL